MPKIQSTKVEHSGHTTECPAGIAVSDDDLKAVQSETDQFHPDWNYRVRPRSVASSERATTPRSKAAAPRQNAEMGAAYLVATNLCPLPEDESEGLCRWLRNPLMAIT